MILRQSVQIRVPIRLIDTSGNPVTGKLPADVSGAAATLVKSDGSTTSIALTNASNWWEIDATNAPGLYHIQLTTTHTNTIGPTQLVVRPAATAFVTGVYTFTVESFQATVATNLDAVLSTTVTAAVTSIKGASSKDITQIDTKLGTPAGASVSVDVAAVKTDTGTLTTRIPGTVQPQTGDSYARLGAPVGASISADVADVKTDTQNLKDWGQGKWKIETTGPDANKIIFYKPDGVTLLGKFALFDANGNPTTVNPYLRSPA